VAVPRHVLVRPRRPLWLHGARRAPPPRSRDARRARAGCLGVITGLAHAAVCVPDVDAAVQWYADVLGCRVLSPPYRMVGTAIERDMGELVPSPVVVKAAIVGFAVDDRVIELI